MDEDLDVFVSFTVALSRFNRAHHADECKYDDEHAVYDAIAKSSKAFFEARDETSLILIAENGTIPIGYAVGRSCSRTRVRTTGPAGTAWSTTYS